MVSQSIALVNWGMGTTLIGIFAAVCLTLAFVVVKMVNSDKKKKED